MNDGVGGVAAPSRHEPRSRSGAAAAACCTASGSSRAVAQTGAFETTATRARRSLPSARRTPTQRPSLSHISSSTWALSSTCPSRFSTAATSASATACEPPIG